MGGFFRPVFPKGKKGPKKPPKNPPQNSPRVLVGKIPLGFLQRPFLENRAAVKGTNLKCFPTVLCKNLRLRKASFYRKRRESAKSAKISESVSTEVWCVPGFGAGFEIALEPSKLQI